MAFELSFGPEFFIGPHDFEGIEFDKDRPTSVWQALMVMEDKAWAELAREVFNCDPVMLEADKVLDKIRETDTCRDLRDPVEVYIDKAGYHTVEVHSSTEG